MTNKTPHYKQSWFLPQNSNKTQKLNSLRNFLELIPFFLRKRGRVLFFFFLGIFLLKILLCAAQEQIPLEERIFQKLGAILEAQSKIQNALDKILSNQEEIKKEIEIIKIRATVH